MMQDGKALQSGTSHNLGQNFAKAFDVTFVNKENKPEYVWANSWGVSTRLMGALIMAHSDDNGLVLPPHLAPIQVVIVPIFKNAEQLAKITETITPIIEELAAKGISVKFDDDDKKRPDSSLPTMSSRAFPCALLSVPAILKPVPLKLCVAILSKSRSSRLPVCLNQLKLYLKKFSRTYMTRLSRCATAV